MIYNSRQEEIERNLPKGKWEVLVDAHSSRLWQNPFVTEGTIRVEGRSVLVLGQTGKEG